MRWPGPIDSDEYRPLAVARTMFVDKVDRGVAETILEHIKASTGQTAVTQLRVLGGAMARVPVEATAFAHRSSRIMVNLAAIYGALDEKPAHEAWVRAFADAIRQDDGGAYVNFIGDEGEARVRAAYPGPTWDRLPEIKRRTPPSPTCAEATRALVTTTEWRPGPSTMDGVPFVLSRPSTRTVDTSVTGARKLPDVPKGMSTSANRVPASSSRQSMAAIPYGVATDARAQSIPTAGLGAKMIRR